MVSGTGNKLWMQNQSAAGYTAVALNTNPMAVGQGYIMRAPTSQTFSFTGTPNSGTINMTVPVISGNPSGYYLVGNPYPSCLNWDAISTAEIETTIWFKTCTSGGAMRTDTYNSVSNAGTNNNGNATVDSILPPMQAFWVKLSNLSVAGSISFNPNQRTHNWGTAPFLHSPAAKSSKKDILRFYVYSGTNRDETILIQSESAQNSYDNWDSYKFFSNEDPSTPQIYSISPERYRLVIQSVKPIVKTDTLELGLNVGVAGTYKFVANPSESSLTKNIYLLDRKSGVTQDLLANPEYTFTSEIVTDTTRFALVFAPVPLLITHSPAPVCFPEAVDLTTKKITEGSPSGYTYTYWKDSEAKEAYLTPDKAEAGNYYIKGTAANGTYTISDPITVIINNLPTVVANSPSAICSPATIDLTESAITQGSNAGLSYTYWTNNAATEVYSTPKNSLKRDILY